MIDHYAVNKFLYDTDRNEGFVQRYIDDPKGYVDWWLEERGNRLLDNESERSSVAPVDDDTRRALAEYDFVTLYREGAHPFILWTLMLPIIEDKLAKGEWDVADPDDARSENKKPMAYYREHIGELGRPDFRY